MKLLRSVLVLALVLFARDSADAADVVSLDLNAATKEYCHVLRFPSGWQMPRYFEEKDGSFFFPRKFGLGHDYEFRVPGLQGTRFLVRGVEEVIGNYYTSNIYEADFADPSGVARPVTEEQWNLGTPVPWRNDRPAAEVSAYLKSLRFDPKKSGDKGPGVVLSPALNVLILPKP
jgi:hypothetical protein